jgi:Skp family chaperone for outer membrane proteins
MKAVDTRIKRLQEDAESELSALQGKMFDPVVARVRKAVEEVANDLGMAIVADTSSQASTIVYSPPGIDITSQVIRRADEDAAKSPAGK